MKTMLCFVFLLSTSLSYADSYNLLPEHFAEKSIVVNSVENKPDIETLPKETSVEETFDVIGIFDVDETKEVEVEVENTEEERRAKLQYWYDTYKYLSGALGTGILGMLARIGYVFVQTKRGKLVVKHIRNEANTVADDIIDSIDNLTKIESGEVLRDHLKHIQNQLIAIAKEKLPPKPKY